METMEAMSCELKKYKDFISLFSSSRLSRELKVIENMDESFMAEM